MATSTWDQLTAHVGELQTLAGVHGLLQWDQQTQMPSKGAALRAEQNAVMARLVHQRLTAPELGDWLAELATSEDADQRAAVAHLHREYDRNTRIPADLVDAMARAEAQGFEAWMAARDAEDIGPFADALTTLIDLSKQKAAAIDSERSAYDVLLDQFDLGTQTATLTPLFARLQAGLVELVQATRDAPPVPALDLSIPVDVQHHLHERLIAALGYELDAGRLDRAQHPFSIGLGAGDVRITTHLYEDDVLHGLSGTVHEAGHAMYEQGLPHGKWKGTGLNAAASYGLHESQSRFWENTIGASLPFFRWFSGLLQDEGYSASADALYRSANRIQPGLIRISADEVTYNLHIILRFELEVALFAGDLTVAELPAAWNDGMKRLLGTTPKKATEGVLQDVHWSGGAFGYFPSYTLGNLYAASFTKQIGEDLPDLWDHVQRGEFGPVLHWLREHVHQHGSRYLAPEIVKRAVGERDHVEDLLDHVWSRHGALYGVRRTA